MRFLADTNIISELMRSQPNSLVLAKWRAHYWEVAIAAVSWHELLTGVFRLPSSKRRKRYEQFLHEVLILTVPVLPYDQAAAAWHAGERARLMNQGQTPSFADGQIAAIAARRNLTLITRNTVDFAGFTDIKIENWFQS